MQTFVRKKIIKVLTNICSDTIIRISRKNRRSLKLIAGEDTMKKSFIFLWLGVITGCAFLGIFFMNALAKEPQSPKMVSYYTCIRIEPGDTIWSIAETYSQGTDISVEDYVLRLKQMNHIGEDTIHAGRYLTIMYQLPETEEKSTDSSEGCSEHSQEE